MAMEPQTPGAYTRVLLDRVGRGKNAKAIRRPFLFAAHDDRLLELQTAYIELEFGLESLNAQIAVLADLTFLHDWTSLKKSQDPSWIEPQYRAAADKMPLTQQEVKDYGRWCQRKARSLKKAICDAKPNVVRLPDADVVGTRFRNRRLRNASLFLQWLVTSLATTNDGGEADISLTEIRKQRLARWFDKQLLSDPKALPPGSLDAGEAQALRQVIADRSVFPDTAIGTRDRLVLELLEQGLRAGELLKAQVADVNDAYRIDLGRTVGIISIERRPNDVDDERRREPAVKTRPGKLSIPKRLAQALLAYVTGARRAAIDARGDGVETPYLFVNHTGQEVGRPLGQRNLNRIVAKLKGRFGLPSSLKPHALRHTHFTELYDRLRQEGKSRADIRPLMIDRGRWGPKSKMPDRYTARSLMRESADYVEERDRRLQRG